MSYDPDPTYPVVGGAVRAGYATLAAEAGARGDCVVAVDGPAALRLGDRFASSLGEALCAAGLQSHLVDAREGFARWSEIERRTASSDLPRDPVFARVWEGSIEELWEGLATLPNGEVAVVYGPGSALVRHDVLWYADFPKGHALEAVRGGRGLNIGQGRGSTGSERRLLFVDWPLQDRHKRTLESRLDAYIDLTDPAAPRWLDGESLRRSLRSLATDPFRTRPTFLPGPWGGQWLRRTLGVQTAAPNLAWSYELITPESGLLLGGRERLEVGFELLMAGNAESILGAAVKARFGTSFPVRFDYLDTLEGGHLSIQTHPDEDYMRETFGLPVHAARDVLRDGHEPGGQGLPRAPRRRRLDAFRADARRAERSGVAFEPERYLLAHPAEQHRLYLIPAGTPHASGAGNVVLEISATPYLYTLRFYDWLRRDLDGELRPVHVEHAFANLNAGRRGAELRRLMPEPSVVRAGTGLAGARSWGGRRSCSSPSTGSTSRGGRRRDRGAASMRSTSSPAMRSSSRRRGASTRSRMPSRSSCRPLPAPIASVVSAAVHARS